MHRTRASIALAAVVAVLGTIVISAASPATATGLDTTGKFEPVFSRGGLFNNAPPGNPTDSAKEPTAVSDVALPNGQFLYWNGLENLENAPTPLAADGGTRASLGHPSRSRLMSNPGANATWSVPTPEGGGGGDMFCADQRILLDGTVMVTGGTVWKDDPVDASQYAWPNGLPGGTTELFGNRATRIFNPDSNSWSQVGAPDPQNNGLEGTPNDPASSSGSYSGYMHYGRWYPALVTLPSGKLLVAGGVGRLIYNSTGFNVSHTETFDPFNSSGGYDPVHGKWIDNGANGASTFPLFPRLHVIADGKVFYGAAGQMWGPFGQAADEALWNFMKFYDPTTNNWTDVGSSNGPDVPTALSRDGNWGAVSGASEIMLPFAPDSSGNYKTTQIIQAGGVLGTSPGTFAATNLARKITIDGNDNVSTAQIASTNNRRWYSNGILGATGEPMIFSGADKDEVVCGGCEQAVRQAEMYDVGADKWVPMDTASRDRTYHNSAILLADGRVLTGGHSPINFGYGPGGTGPTGNNSAHDNGLPFANNFKDPSFQIFDPPYLFRGPQPTITNNISGWLNWGNDYNITTPDAATVDDAILVHMPATTHITDADMRAVVLPITQRLNGSVKVHIPTERGVAIPGWYYLFLRQTNPSFTKPTVSKSAIIVRVGNPSELGMTSVSRLGAAHVTHIAAAGTVSAAVAHGVKASVNAIAPKSAPVSSRSSSSTGTGAALLASLIAAAAVITRSRIRRKAH